MSIPGMIAHERLVESLLSNREHGVPGWVSQETGRLVVEGPCETPQRSEQHTLQEKKTRYVKIQLKLQVADP